MHVEHQLSAYLNTGAAHDPQCLGLVLMVQQQAKSSCMRDMAAMSVEVLISV